MRRKIRVSRLEKRLSTTPFLLVLPIGSKRGEPILTKFGRDWQIRFIQSFAQLSP